MGYGHGDETYARNIIALSSKTMEYSNGGLALIMHYVHKHEN
jgi:hypothetical protein